jgi:hypothetical protein
MIGFDLTKANDLYRNTRWLHSAPALAMDAWHSLIVAIDSLSRPDDRFTLPDAREPFAWRRAWPIYVGLRRRENLPPDPAVVAQEQADERFAENVNQAWSEYLQNFADLTERRRLGELTADVVEYLELRAGDFLQPMSNDAAASRFGGKRPDWPEAADRIDHALKTWRSLTAAQRSFIPMVLTLRRIDARLATVEEQLAERPAKRRKENHG